MLFDVPPPRFQQFQEALNGLLHSPLPAPDVERSVHAEIRKLQEEGFAVPAGSPVVMRFEDGTFLGALLWNIGETQTTREGNCCDYLGSSFAVNVEKQESFVIDWYSCRASGACYCIHADEVVMVAHTKEVLDGIESTKSSKDIDPNLRDLIAAVMIAKRKAAN
jgi:hypothetical protein